MTPPLTKKKTTTLFLLNWNSTLPCQRVKVVGSANSVISHAEMTVLVDVIGTMERAQIVQDIFLHQAAPVSERYF